MTVIEKQLIIAGLAKGLTLLDLPKELGRDKKSLFSFVERPNARPRKDKGHYKKYFSNVDISTGNQMTTAPLFFPKLASVHVQQHQIQCLG